MTTNSTAISFGPGSGGDGGGTASGGPDRPAARPTGPGRPHGDWRAITVGRTGLEQMLRRESGIELIRARSTFEAVGELSDALESDALESDAATARDGHDGDARVQRPLGAGAGAGLVAASEPLRCMVLVAHDAATDEIAGSFVAAIKSMQKNVAVVLVTPAQAVASAVASHPAFDAVIASNASPSDVRRVAEAVLASAMPTAPSRQSQPIGPLPGETALLTALLAGRDVLLTALGLLRERTGDASITFVAAVPPETLAPGAQPPASQAADSESPLSADANAVALEPVVHRGKLFGYLRLNTQRVSRAERVAAASWLSIYLALHHQQAALRTAAMVDDLTGAYNRRYFERFMATALAQAQRERHTLTLLVFDLDGFKGFNDRFGHAAGDEILRETVSLLRSVIRPGDKVCRIGGDEFAVIFYEPTGPRDIGSKPPEDVSIIAQRFQQQVRAHRFPKLGGAAPGALTISGGLATFPWDGRTARELLAHADGLALAAKRDGKNAIRIGPDGSGRSSSYGNPPPDGHRSM